MGGEVVARPERAVWAAFPLTGLRFGSSAMSRSLVRSQRPLEPYLVNRFLDGPNGIDTLAGAVQAAWAGSLSAR